MGIENNTDDWGTGYVKQLIVLNVAASAALFIASFRRFIGLFTRFFFVSFIRTSDLVHSLAMFTVALFDAASCCTDTTYSLR